MNVFLLCCPAGAGGVAKRGVFLGCLCVFVSTFLCVNVWWSASVIFWLMVVTFDGLGRGMGQVLDFLGHGVGGLIVCSVLQHGLGVGTGVYW